MMHSVQTYRLQRGSLFKGCSSPTTLAVTSSVLTLVERRVVSVLLDTTEVSGLNLKKIKIALVSVNLAYWTQDDNISDR